VESEPEHERVFGRRGAGAAAAAGRGA
jgi:hypothetical protein